MGMSQTILGVQQFNVSLEVLKEAKESGKIDNLLFDLAIMSPFGITESWRMAGKTLLDRGKLAWPCGYGDYIRLGYDLESKEGSRCIVYVPRHSTRYVDVKSRRIVESRELGKEEIKKALSLGIIKPERVTTGHGITAAYNMYMASANDYVCSALSEVHRTSQKSESDMMAEDFEQKFNRALIDKLYMINDDIKEEWGEHERYQEIYSAILKLAEVMARVAFRFSSTGWMPDGYKDKPGDASMRDKIELCSAGSTLMELVGDPMGVGDLDAINFTLQVAERAARYFHEELSMRVPELVDLYTSINNMVQEVAATSWVNEAMAAYLRSLV